METVRIFANKDFLCEKVAGLACIMFDYEAKQENMPCCCRQLSSLVYAIQKPSRLLEYVRHLL